MCLLWIYAMPIREDFVQIATIAETDNTYIQQIQDNKI